MSEIRVTATGLRCFTGNPHHGQLIMPLDPGDHWDEITEAVREHQAEHGCARVTTVRSGVALQDCQGVQIGHGNTQVHNFGGGR